MILNSCYLFTSLKNAQLSKKNSFICNKTKNNENFLKIFWTNGFILGYKIIKNSNKFKVFLKYNKNKPIINKIKIISKPSRKIYYCVKKIWKINSNNFIIFSTNKGLKSLPNCKKNNLGGKMCVIIN